MVPNPNPASQTPIQISAPQAKTHSQTPNRPTNPPPLTRPTSPPGPTSAPQHPQKVHTSSPCTPPQSSASNPNIPTRTPSPNHGQALISSIRWLRVVYRCTTLQTVKRSSTF